MFGFKLYTAYSLNLKVPKKKKTGLNSIEGNASSLRSKNESETIV